jgi:hypothetical protein
LVALSITQFDPVVNPFRDRLVVGLQTLNLTTVVRIHVPDLINLDVYAKLTFRKTTNMMKKYFAVKMMGSLIFS